MKAAIYARVSTDEQHYENQLAVLREAAARAGLQITEEYVESESAYKDNKQYALMRLKHDIMNNKIRVDVIYIWALDRLCRKGITETSAIVKLFDTYGVSVYSYQETWMNVDGAMRELLMAIFSWLAHQESVKISERTKAGLERAKAQGIKLGRPTGSKDKKKRKRPNMLTYKPPTDYDKRRNVVKQRIIAIKKGISENDTFQS